MIKLFSKPETNIKTGFGFKREGMLCHHEPHLYF